MALRRPIKIGKYEVVDLLGKGGMGVVYKATDPFLGRSVAIKMMTTVDYVDNPDLLQRFYREAQSTGSLHHRNIVTVYELGDQEGSPYLVMEYLEGETLDAIIHSRRPLTLLDKINFIIEVCDGMAYAHERSVVHRDIKPGNIMVLKDSGVKIVDFGIAHIGNRTVTRTGQLLGSLPYMSPEQISGRQVDARTDIFSLGVVLYQLLTFHLPFDGETPASTLLKIMHEKPRPLTEYKESFPPELDSIILRALAKDREERYATAQDLAYDLVQIRGRIQLEMVEESLHEAESLLAREEFLKAKEKLAEVLKIDRHNTRAVELSRTAQQRIQQQEMGEQVRQLRGQAEEAYQRDEFVLALDLIQKALNLHSTDPDLQRFRSSVQQAKTQAERLQRSLQRAESAYEQGELDSAKQAIEEALALAPDDVHAKSLYRTIQRDWTQRAQRLQVHNLIEEARKEIASRNFTMALEVLRKAEAIDPGAPQLQALIDAAKAAREQEQRRKLLENIKREIEADLDRDDFQVACTRAEAALQQFPDDRGLQKLKDLAVKQRALAERAYFIEEQAARARKLLEAGRTEEVLDLLQSAQQKVGGDAHLDSLLVLARETLERQRIEARKVDYLRRAKDQLRLKEYVEAIRTLEAAQSELGTNPEIDDLLQFAIEQSAAEKKRQIADAAAEKAQALVKDQDYDKAVEVLEAALREGPDEELRIILVQTRHAAADHHKLLDDAIANAESMIQGQRPIEALKYLQSQPASFSRDSRFVELSQRAGQQAERLKHVEQALEKARVFFGRDECEQARSVLDECVRVYGRTVELNKLVSEIEERQMQVVSETLEKALAESRALISAGNPEEALDRLGLAQTMAGMVPKKLSHAYQALQQEAINAQARKYKTDAERLLAKGEHADALGILQRAQSEFPQNRELQQVRKALDQAIQRRADAQKLLDRAQELFRQKSWREGGDICLRAGPLSSRDPVLRKDILSALEAAAAASLETDWRHAEYLVQSMAQFQPNVGLPGAVQEKIAQARREEEILQCLNEAKFLQTSGDLDKALREVETGLAAYPDDARLSALKQSVLESLHEREERARQERERQEKEVRIAEIQRQLEREPGPEARITILEEALRAYPDDATLQNSLAEAQASWQKVTSLAEEAKSWEKSRSYEKAIQSWLAIRELAVPYPGLEASVARLRRLQEEARAAAKAAWLKGIQDALSAFDFETASSLLADAQREFAGDAELVQIGKTRDKAVKQREEALRLVAEAQKAFHDQRWQQGSDLLRRCSHSAGSDPSVSAQVFAVLVQGSRSALPTNLRAAETLLGHAAEIQPDSPEVADLRLITEKQAREEIIHRHLADAQAVAEAGDAQGALSGINHALSNYPDEPRFLERKQELERDIQFEQEAREKNNKLLEILDSAQSLRSEGDLAGSMAKIQEGLAAFPHHAQFLEMKRAVETAIRDQEDQQRREQQQRQKQLEREEAAKRIDAEEAERQRKQEKQQQEQLKREEAARKAAAEEAERQRKQKEKQQQEQLKREEAARKAAAEEAERQRKRQEAADREAQEEQRKQRNAKLAQLPKPQEPPHSDRDYDTQVWRGAALPAETATPRPKVLPTPIQPLHAPAAETTVSGSEAGRKPLKLYAAAAGIIVVVAILSPFLWKALHKSSTPGTVTMAVRIVTTPAGASVHVKDSSQSCVTPQCTLNLSPGDYEVRVELPGYESVTRTISVAQDVVNPVTLSLTPLPPANPTTPAARGGEVAHLDLRGAQPGAEVFVDKQQMGKVGRRGTFSANVPPGNHEIQLLAKNQPSSTVARYFSSGGRVELSSRDFAPPKISSPTAIPSREESEWQQVKDSSNIEEVDGFVKRYPQGAFSLQAQSKLEDLYWARATSGGTAAAFNQYADRFPQGKYSQQAQGEIAKLEWHSLESSNDPAAVETFLKKHPSGSYHDKALAKLDDLTWQRTGQSDIFALRSYVEGFPEGRHAGEARRKIDDLTRTTKVARTTEPRVPEAPPVDEKKAILDVLGRYQKAYEGQDIQELQKIWPGMSTQQVNSLGDFFRHASGLTLEYRLNGQPEIDGDHAIVRFTQSLKYVVGGKSGKDSAKVVMQLNKLQGAPGTWRIDSIR